MTAGTVSAQLYTEVLQFYALQMQALDNRKFDEFAGTFTEDGEFAHTAGRPASRTRPGIVADLEEFHRTSVGDDVRRRHSFSMHQVSALEEGVLAVTVYATVLRITPGSKPEMTFSGLAHDILVHVDGRLQTRSRTVVNDADR